MKNKFESADEHRLRNLTMLEDSATKNRKLEYLVSELNDANAFMHSVNESL